MKISESEFHELTQQKRKELFNPILSGNLVNNNSLELLTHTLMATLQKIQKEDGNVTPDGMKDVIEALLVSWELRDEIYGN